MQVPQRRAQLLRIRNDDDLMVHLTPSALQRLKDLLRDLEHERPQIVEDLRIALQKGDLSENAEYQDAKARLMRIDGRIFSTKEKIKNAVLIEKGPDDSGRIRIGSTVVVAVNGKQRTYMLVGSQESDPAHGRISYSSPLGSALIGHAVGESVSVQTENGDVSYGIVEIT